MRHNLVAGGGYRHIDEVMVGRGGYSFTPNRVTPNVLNAFAQDTIAMAGSRVEVTSEIRSGTRNQPPSES